MAHRTILFAVSMSLLLAASGSSAEAQTKHACEHETLSITCPAGSVIHVVKAFYGRTSDKYCARGPRKTYKCSSSRAQGIIASKCNNKKSCSVKSSNSVFGDPCVGTFKYTTVEYRCHPKGDQTKHACEHDTLSISCPAGYVIHVVKAFYGRTSNKYCARGPRKTYNCSSSRAQGVIGDKCNNKPSCSVKSSNSVFGDPCIGTFKYTTVTYRCYTKEVRKKHACEHDTLSISCPTGYVIHVVRGFYGRTSNKYCARGPRKTYNCSSSQAEGIIESKCNNKRSCSVASSNSVFGDPCYGTFKYTAVEYRCYPQIQ